mgnify:CR=1 FL=1
MIKSRTIKLTILAAACALLALPQAQQSNIVLKLTGAGAYQWHTFHRSS